VNAAIRRIADGRQADLADGRAVASRIHLIIIAASSKCHAMPGKADMPHQALWRHE
jgi:hypothetical protein